MTRVISLLLAAATVTAQQRPVTRPIPSGTSGISGRVIDSITKEPVAGCRLEVKGSGFVSMVVSAEDGAYQLKDIAAGEYFFNIQCPAHLMSCFPTIWPPSRAEADEALRRTCLVDVVRDQQRDAANFLVTPGAIARGRVVGSDGRPIPGASVRLGRGMRAGGVELIAGKTTADLDVTVPRINENSLTVSVPPPDGTISDVVVSVLQQSPLIARRLSLNADGIGALKGIVPGRYFALALASSKDRRWAGFEVVDFLEGDHEARLQLLPTGSIAGRVIADQGAAPAFDGVMVTAAWIHDNAEVNPLEFAEARVAADGSFRIDDLFGTRKLQVRALGLEWDVVAIRQDRSDVTTSGVVVVPDATTDATIVLRRR